MHTQLDITDNSQHLKLILIGLGCLALLILITVNLFIPIPSVTIVDNVLLSILLIIYFLVMLYATFNLHAYGLYMNSDGIRFKRLGGEKIIKWSQIKKFGRGNVGQSYKVYFDGGFIYFSRNIQRAHAILDYIKHSANNIQSSEW